MFEPHKFRNLLFTIFIGSLVIYWLYFGFFTSPFIQDEIKLIENFSEISESENWEFSTYMTVIFGNLLLVSLFLLAYIFFVVPVFIIPYYKALIKIEGENQKKELLKIHFYHTLITLIFAYIIVTSFEKLSN